jgi:predicted DNA-binding transcriptional regulator YafY
VKRASRLRKGATTSEPRADERILQLLLLLLDAGNPTSRAEIFDAIPAYRTRNPAAGERKFERDKKELRELGVPIEEPEDEPGQYVVDRRMYELPPVELGDDERIALVLAAEVLRSSDGIVHRDMIEDALRKLSFDGGLLSHAFVPGHLAVALPPRRRSGKLRKLVSELTRAVEGRKRVTIAYAGLGGELTERSIDPYALVYGGGDWQLVGQCHLRDAPRTFRVDRIQRLKIAGKPGTPDFDRPSDWNLSTYVQRSPWVFQAGGTGASEIVLEIGPERSWVADEDFGPHAMREPMTSGWVRLRFQSGNADYVVTRVLDATGHLRIVAPVALRERVRRTAATVADLYAPRGEAAS